MKHLALLMFLPAALHAAIVTTEVGYSDASGTPLHGELVTDDTWEGKCPGVLIIHDWRGVSEETLRRARMIAGLGYVAFAADIYGKDIKGASPKEWAAEAGTFKGDRTLYRERARAAYDVLRNLPQVDPDRIAAIGYCFGGTGVIEMARDGLDLRGVVSFHGGLDRQPLSPGASIKARALLLCGTEDPYQKPEDLRALEDQLKELGVSYRIISYPGAVHAFTDPGVDALELRGARYNKEADRASWLAMRDFLRDVLQ